MTSRRPESDPAWGRSLLFLFASALILRLLYVAELAGTPFFTVPIGDAKEYDAWARRIAGGEWRGAEVFYQTPLYPYLLAMIFTVFGHHLIAVRVIQAILGAFACVLLAVAGRRFFDERTGLFAGLMLAAYPPALFFDSLLQKASLDLVLMAGLLALVGRIQIRPDGWAIAALGSTLGLLTLNRENARVLFPVLVLWILIADREVPVRQRAGRALLLTASVSLILLPVGWRNYAVGGDFLLSTSQLGPNFYIGNHKNAPGTYQELVPGHGNASYERGDAKDLAEAAAGRSLSAREVSDHWLSRGLAYIRDEPLDWLRLLGRKLLLTFSATEIVDTESLDVYADHSWVLRTLSWIHFGLALPLAVLGMWLTRAEWRRLGILHAMWVATAAAVALFFVVARYRYPLVPIVLLFAAATLSRLGEVVRHPPARLWVGALAAIVAALVVNRTPGLPEDDTYNNIGSELIRLNRPAEAIPLLERAMQAAPDYAVPCLNLGIAYQKTGETSRAIEMFERAVRLRPDYVEAHADLALTLQGAGRSEEAIRHFREALRSRPDSAEIHNNLGSTLASMGRSAEAIAEYQESLRLKPGSAKAHNNLAVALQQQDRIDAAIPHYLQALAIDPAYAEAHSNLGLAFASQGDAVKALQHFREAIRLMPGAGQVRLNAGDLLIAMGRLDEAVAELETARNLSPGSLESRTSLAQAYARSGRLNEAIVELQEALKLAHSAGRREDAAAIERLIQACRARLARR